MRRERAMRLGTGSIVLAGLLALAGLIVGVRLRAPRPEPAAAPPPTLLFTNDIMGYLQVACGCRGYGGVVERARLLLRSGLQ